MNSAPECISQIFHSFRDNDVLYFQNDLKFRLYDPVLSNIGSACLTPYVIILGFRAENPVNFTSDLNTADTYLQPQHFFLGNNLLGSTDSYLYKRHDRLNLSSYPAQIQYHPVLPLSHPQILLKVREETEPSYR